MGVDVAADEQFGPYLVYERLGVGGMATVHRALERGIEGFERMVALKRLLPHLAEDASFIKSFVREAKLASLLNHVNIVQIFELGRVGTEYFISMEYIDGRDLRRILRHARKVTGPPPLRITVGLLLQLCEALDYAHAKVGEDGQPLGLVHRDVSPSNLLVTSAGHLKVIDFGIARAQSQQLRTQTGRVKGKLAYMAPEAISGKDLDARSDLFAVGVIAHELLTARPLFASKNEYQTLLKVQRGDIMAPSTFNQACPTELDDLVLRALARDPDDRCSTAGEMRDELLAIRQRYNLQTGHREIAQWLAWAFSIEAPSGGVAAVHTGNDSSSVFDATGSRRTPARQSRDDDEAVDVAWGGGEQDHSGHGVVLDDVPDVSDKHLLNDSVASRLGAVPDLGGLDADDIPASQPSHGLRRARDVRTLSDADDSLADELDADELDDALDTVAALGPPSRPTPTRTSRERRDTAQGHTPLRARPGTSEPVTHPSARPYASWPDASNSHDDLVTHPGDPDPARTQPSVPRVRFRSPTQSPGPIATTLPGHTPAVPLATPMPARRAERTSSVTIDPAITSRRSLTRPWLIAVGLGLAGAAAAVTLLVTRRDGQHAPRASLVDGERPGEATVRTRGTVKFLTEPADAEISIVAGSLAHTGSPWAVQLEPGNHQIQIQREGYKAWLTTLELSANETQTLRVVLEPLTPQAVESAEATLILASTPLGLDVVLDGKPLGLRTPVKLPLAPGPHRIALRQHGQEVWRHDVIARAAVDYEFSPSMAANKQHERAARVTPPPPTEPVTRRADVAPAIVANVTPSESVATAIRPPPDRPATPSPPAPIRAPTAHPVIAPPPPAPLPRPAVTTPAPSMAITPTAPARILGPVVVPPTAVTRVSGDVPSLGKTKRAEVPAVVAAKVCIDPSGKVASVQMITKLERLTSVDLDHAIKTWRYAPYKQGGVAVSACFVVSFRVQ